MCFSTEASFAAALVLGSAGGITLKNSPSTSYFFLAAIPFIFALQQLSEGFVWLHFSQGMGSQFMFNNAQRAFLIFAFLVWPIWIPLSLAAVEKIYWRRILLILLLISGIILSTLNFLAALHQEISVKIINKSLQYIGQVPSQTFAYPLIILLPCFLSSLKNIWIYGVVIALSYLAADYFYTVNFVSVWCFFAAIASLSVYKIVKDNQEMPKEGLSKKTNTLS